MFDLVVFYARNLAVPMRRRVDAPEVLRGKQVFYQTGCPACHTPKYLTRADPERPELSRQLIWPYTDLLLHDMGPGLADGRSEGRATGQEWRTPPLWGIGLHGRRQRPHAVPPRRPRAESPRGGPLARRRGRDRKAARRPDDARGARCPAGVSGLALSRGRAADRPAAAASSGPSPSWLVLVLRGPGGPARAEESERDPAYRRLNASLIEHHVLPRYARLADATAAFEVAARRFCAAPATAPLDEVRRAFHAAADAWHDVEHVRFGPMTSRLRAERLYFWPDPRNATARQLGELLAGRDPAALTAEGFVRASAAVQGLPAVERLLFDEGAAAAFRRAATRAVVDARCWRRSRGTSRRSPARSPGSGAAGRRPTRGGSRRPGRGTRRTRSRRRRPRSLLKSLHGGLERVASLKLAKPLGASLAAARPMLAEEWRSGRALRDVRLNLAAARALYLGDGGIRAERLRPGRRPGARARRPAPPRLRRSASRPPTRCRAARVGGQEPAAPVRRWSGCSRRSGPSAHRGGAPDDRPRPAARLQCARWRLNRREPSRRRAPRVARGAGARRRRGAARRERRAALPERPERRRRTSLRERLRRDGRAPARPDAPRRGHAFAVHPRDRRRSSSRGARDARPTSSTSRAGASSPRSRPPPAGTSAVTGSTRATAASSVATEEVGDEGAGSWGATTRPRATGASGESPSHGVGPHEVTVLADGRTLVVANGGIVTHADAPGVKLDRDRMRPTLVAPRRPRRPAPRRGPAARAPVAAQPAPPRRSAGGTRSRSPRRTRVTRATCLPLAAVWRRREGLSCSTRAPRSRPGCAGTAAARQWTPPARCSACRAPAAASPSSGTSGRLGWSGPSICRTGAAWRRLTRRARSSSRAAAAASCASSCPDERVTPLPASFVAHARWDNHLAVGRTRPARG